MALNTCRTCRHRESRLVVGAPADGRPTNHYCAHPGRDDMPEDGTLNPIANWIYENKPNRCLPVVGARDCPGHER